MTSRQWRTDWLDLARSWEPTIEAWKHLPFPERPVAAIPGPLAGVPFGVKDVIDVAGMPTGCGWDGLSDARPAPADAAVVATLRAAGAVPAGKTRSTAFAFIDPTISRNPHDPGRTPGGSSSGSGAVVGAGVVPFALGTQTAGSLCRPAAYCGAFAYKPGLAVLSVEGMQALSHSFDAVGVIAADLDWLMRVADVLLGSDIRHSASSGKLRIGRISASEQTPDPALVRAIDQVEQAMLAAGHDVSSFTSPIPFSDLLSDHRTIMLAEAVGNIVPVIGDDLAAAPPLLRAGLEEGRMIPPDAPAAAQQRIARARDRFWGSADGFDVLLAYPTTGAAPRGLTTTGDQSYLTPWTALGGPLTTVPCGVDDDGMPLAGLLAMRPGADKLLLQNTNTLAPLFPQVPKPRHPA
ncbi:MAG: amidase family protein [Minwuia sp.]|nr:amidase family protein [Minwuia sp.]